MMPPRSRRTTGGQHAPQPALRVVLV
jgi:hypothetical protein